MATKVRDRVAVTFLLLLLLDSFGFNNIPLGPIPVVLAVSLSLSAWYGITEFAWLKERTPFQVLLALFAVVVAVVALRLPYDLHKTGINAARDSLFLVDVGAVFVGAGLARSLGRRGLARAISWVLIGCLVWFALEPASAWLTLHSPIVGVQRPEPLFSFYSVGYVSVVGFAWFAPRRGATSKLAAMAFLIIMFFGQFKSSVLAVGTLLVVVLGVYAARSWQYGNEIEEKRALLRIPVILGVAAVLAVGLSVMGVSTPGRLGSATPVAVLDRVLHPDAAGTPGAESVNYRLSWQSYSVSRVLRDGFTVLAGDGLGTDLTGGFTSSTDAPVRNPHNDFLEYSVRLGFIAGLAWLGMVVGVPTYLALKTRDHLVLVASMGFLISWWFFSATQSFFSFTYGGFPFWVVVGLLLAQNKSEESSKSFTRLENAPGVPVATGL